MSERTRTTATLNDEYHYIPLDNRITFNNEKMDNCTFVPSICASFNSSFKSLFYRFVRIITWGDIVNGGALCRCR